MMCKFPLLVAVPSPDVKSAIPPLFVTLRLEPHRIIAPEPLVPLPTLTLDTPPRPLVLTPEPNRVHPELPAALDPELKTKKPLLPLMPPFIEITSMDPLLVMVPSPKLNVNAPPVDESPRPEQIRRCPPPELVLLPTLIRTPRLVPADADPVPKWSVPLLP